MMHPLEKLLYQEAEFSAKRTEKERMASPYWSKYLQHLRKLSWPFEIALEEFVYIDQEDTDEYSLSALNCIRKYMRPKDWDDIESLARQQNAEDWIIWYFDTLKQWLHVGPPIPLPVDRLPDYTRQDKLDEGGSIRKQLWDLSKKIEAFAPELSEEYALLRVLEPWCYAEEPIELTGGNPDASDLEEATSPYSTREIFFELRGPLSHLKRVIKRRKAYGLEVPIAGPLGVLSDIARYIEKEEKRIEKEPRVRPKYPVWCKAAARDLWKVLNCCRLFKHASLTMKHRIIEYMIYAYADYHNLEPPGEGWGPDQLAAATRGP